MLNRDVNLISVRSFLKTDTVSTAMECTRQKIRTVSSSHKPKVSNRLCASELNVRTLEIDLAFTPHSSSSSSGYPSFSMIAQKVVAALRFNEFVSLRVYDVRDAKQTLASLAWPDTS